MTSTDKGMELKLRFEPQHMTRIAQSLSSGSGAAEARSLRAVYYDTPDRRLWRHGVTLRVRQDGETFVQTVTTGEGSRNGPHRPGEREMELVGREPDLSVFDGEDGCDAAQGLRRGDLEVVFETDVTRTLHTRILHRPAGDCAIEIAVDQGEIRAGTMVRPVCGIELESKDGKAQALFDLAVDLLEQVPVRLEARSMAEHGHALAGGEPSHPVKAGKLEIDRDATVEQAIERIVRACLTHLLANEGSAVRGEDPEGIHQMRVALRRLRSAMVLFKRFVPAEQYEAITGEVKWLTGCLGPARDWDAFTLSLLAPVRDAMPGDGEIDALADTVRKARRDAYRAAREAILSDRYTRLLLMLAGWLEAGALRDQAVSETAARLHDPIGAVAGDLLRKRYRTLRKRGRHFSRLSPEQRHEVRKALKKLRYSIEFLQGLYPGKALKTYQKRLLPLQDDLGELNDVATARTLVDSLARDRTGGGNPSWRVGAGVTVGWHAHAAAGTAARAGRNWRKFRHAKPFWT